MKDQKASLSHVAKWKAFQFRQTRVARAKAQRCRTPGLVEPLQGDTDGQNYEG